MAKHKHLTLQERYEIQHALDERQTFTQIGSNIGKDPSTIAKEVRNHFTVVESGGHGFPFNPCINRRKCDVFNLCGDRTKCRVSKCSLCKGCYNHCTDFEEEQCPMLDKPPYVCNGCPNRSGCTLRKHTYSALSANKESVAVRTESRQGISLTPDEVARIDKVITPLVKQGQSIHHICANNADIIMVDEKTIYNYIDKCIFSFSPIDLPRKVRYRPRKKHNPLKLDKHCYEGRTFNDFQAFMEQNPDTPIVEMDSVEGEKGGKVLMTLFFRETKFMLAFLRDANTARSVNEVVDSLYVSLGPDFFRNLFPVILTDRGSEFSNPLAIEFDSEGNRRTHVFYCNPNSPNQKGGIEVTHELIRRVIPKGTSLNRFQQEDINLMMDNINSYGRKKLNNRSAYQSFSFLYGEDVLAKLGAHYIESNDIVLTPKLLK